MNRREDLFSFPELDLRELPSSLLAYIGDEVMSLCMKLRFIKLLKPSRIEKEVRKRISREGQAAILDEIFPLLTEEEKEVVKRAMNSKIATRHGNDPLYRKSTGLEALIGYLYLKGDEGRIIELLSHY